MKNQLTTLPVSYSEFIAEIKNPKGNCSAILSNSAAISLCKNGIGRNLFNTVLSSTIILWPVIAIAGTMFSSAWCLALFLVVPLHFKVARTSISRSVWKELRGDGVLPYDVRESLYHTLIKHDELWSECWTQLKNEDNSNDDFLSLTELLQALEREFRRIVIRQEREEVEQSKISVTDESFVEYKADGSIAMMGHRDIIDYSKHDMNIEGQKIKTLQALPKLAEGLGLNLYPELYEKVKEELESIDYDTMRYSHGEFNPPDLIICSVAIDIIYEELEV